MGNSISTVIRSMRRARSRPEQQLETHQQPVLQRGTQTNFLSSSDRLRQTDFMDYFITTNGTRTFVLPQERQARQASVEDELPMRIRRFNLVSRASRSLIFKFHLYRIDDGTISDSEIRQIVSEFFMHTDNFATFHDIMQREGKICIFVGTPNQINNPLMMNRIRSFRIRSRTHQYCETPGISDEVAGKILGSPTPWIEGLKEAEIDCAIFLESIQRGEEIKALACKHVYHHACILRSTKRKQKCPICRASYHYWQVQPK